MNTLGRKRRMMACLGGLVLLFLGWLFLFRSIVVPWGIAKAAGVDRHGRVEVKGLVVRHFSSRTWEGWLGKYSMKGVLVRRGGNWWWSADPDLDLQMRDFPKFEIGGDGMDYRSAQVDSSETIFARLALPTSPGRTQVELSGVAGDGGYDVDWR